MGLINIDLKAKLLYNFNVRCRKRGKNEENIKWSFGSGNAFRSKCQCKNCNGNKVLF